MSYVHLTQDLADAFNALASQVQILADQKTVLEHKLRFAHEQVQFLADKYAPTAPEIAETLAKLQLPPHTSVDETSTVPLPLRKSPLSQHQVALIIRDGRRLAGQLISLGDASKTTGSSRETFSQTSHRTSMSTALEQDFTVQGKRGCLECPFSKAASEKSPDADVADPAEPRDHHLEGTPHKLNDPICAAMYEETPSQVAANASAAAGNKCPIRYMDTHSPEEIAHYVKTHTHELPRSHEVCVRRYQRNEEEIRKLDSKYGNLVNMIEGLGHIHQSMLPESEEPHEASAVDRASNERVENWAQTVSAPTSPEEHDAAVSVDGDRQSHFDRPLKEVRVGESPSRPWGISVPVYEETGQEAEQPLSPPPAPVRMTSPVRSTGSPSKAPQKCPFDHTRLTAFPKLDPSHQKPEVGPPPAIRAPQDDPFVSKAEATPASQPAQSQPAFVNSDMTKPTGSTPQMLFTGPVFIGYPIDQAIQFMNQYRGNQ
ncbi:hypothetical protein S7711_07835 [Stachybotrys chartarum IBT 7711]|uniref:Uncharacterized protein n=1 Tax=Stachybotrys chartarum (strain CBS 109288 / IBT 7711) TaxID=1280523 RepID=A0A084AQQ8_STACB|nr:hypothetical protein S7711_07835 [Stachybotrys chartarum IBT 7711]KFA51487.1 hypothetical protein S40293_06773 [Stachybotrys chartarum IBT 40293]KFA73159.1 hypothetical protein S40288_08263 [Stachybotrys chartarum IBT 40288]